MPLNLISGLSILVQLMAWCCQTASHNMSQLIKTMCIISHTIIKYDTPGYQYNINNYLRKYAYCMMLNGCHPDKWCIQHEKWVCGHWLPQMLIISRDSIAVPCVAKYQALYYRAVDWFLYIMKQWMGKKFIPWSVVGQLFLLMLQHDKLNCNSMWTNFCIYINEQRQPIISCFRQCDNEIYRYMQSILAAHLSSCIIVSEQSYVDILIMTDRASAWDTFIIPCFILQV